MRGKRTGQRPGSWYGIKPSYTHRMDPEFFDDTGLTDQWQREVYERASMLAAAIRADRVYDVGCGSGYKLIRNFQNQPTTGFEIEPTLSWLRTTYPEREWMPSDFNATVVNQADLVICADVIEHVQNPTALLRFLARLTRRWLVLSSPDRIAVYNHDHGGPPGNPAHAREWTQAELRKYVSPWFEVTEQKITNRKQGTQMLICRPR